MNANAETLQAEPRPDRGAQPGHPSTAALRGHPLHPAVVPLPIGMLAAAASSDLLHLMTGDRFFARASRWLVGGGVASGIAAAALGLVDFATIRAARGPTGIGHAGGNAAVLTMSGLSLLIRVRAGNRLPASAFVLSAASAGLLLVTGWLGGELAFRQRIGVMPADRSGLPGGGPSTASRPDSTLGASDRPAYPSQAEGER
ncbi:MAG: DUF2231 domain-containing protein [Candidatus Limnocylindria bacterium]